MHLHLRVHANDADTLIAFLREAVPFYEQPGGIQIRLLQHQSDPERFIEVVEYHTHADYERDQERVEHDPEMHQYLARWRSILMEPPKVEIYQHCMI
ncbi:MAG: hypothetical protein H6815_06860 [Phycisphaeraceae bacterium]|nr:hypothetical protein [Phycisphaeraceae bacterium]